MTALDVASPPKSTNDRFVAVRRPRAALAPPSHQTAIGILRQLAVLGFAVACGCAVFRCGQTLTTDVGMRFLLGVAASACWLPLGAAALASSAWRTVTHVTFAIALIGMLWVLGGSLLALGLAFLAHGMWGLVQSRWGDGPGSAALYRGWAAAYWSLGALTLLAV